MVKEKLKKYAWIKFVKRDILGLILKRRKLLMIYKFLLKLLRIKREALLINIGNKGKKNLKNYQFFRILNIPRPIYKRRKTRYGKYFILRQQFRRFYGPFRVRTLQLLMKKCFKKMNALSFFIYYMESRIDTILFRLNIMPSIKSARLFIIENGIIVNGSLIKNSNYRLKVNDILTLKEYHIFRIKKLFINRIHDKFLPGIFIPHYFEFDLDLFLFSFNKFNIHDVPFFVNINHYSFLSFMNFFTKSYF